MANISEIQTPVEPPPSASDTAFRPVHSWSISLWQVVRFSIVGVLNTLIDVVTLNILLWRFPTHNANLLLVYNTIAYTLGALNSFALNKYWTFGRRNVTTSRELLRFAIVNIAGIVCNDSIIWIVARILHPLIASSVLWANLSKGSAVVGTAIVSYFGMRLWVFTSRAQGREKKQGHSALVATDMAEEPFELSNESGEPGAKAGKIRLKHSLSVILPAYNEEMAIAENVRAVVNALMAWVQDFEVIVVNDGSKDATRAIVEDIAASDPHIRIITIL